MLSDAQTLASPIDKPSMVREAAGQGSFAGASHVDQSDLAPHAKSNKMDRVVLRRGPKMMVLFRGRPCSTVVGPLRQAGVTIGLALSSGELPTVRGLGDYGYVFVNSHRRGRSTLAQAVTDLERNSWSVDDNPV